MRSTIVAGFLALAAVAPAGAAAQAPPSPQTPPAAGQATPPAPATRAPAPAASTNPMEAPKLPPFAGEIVNFDRHGTRVVACVDAAKVAAPPRRGPDGKPLPPPDPPPPSGPPRLRIWVLEREIMQELLTTSGLCDPSWSPDGKSFAAAGVRGVFVFTEPNFEPRVLVAGQLQAPPPGAPPARQFNDPVWSPGGAKIAFRTSGAGDARVEVVDVKSAEVLLKREGAAKTLRWADDRTLIVDQARVPLP
jgi:Tol biopolymer transport system component